MGAAESTPTPPTVVEEGKAVAVPPPPPPLLTPGARVMGRINPKDGIPYWAPCSVVCAIDKELYGKNKSAYWVILDHNQHQQLLMQDDVIPRYNRECIRRKCESAELIEPFLGAVESDWGEKTWATVVGVQDGQFLTLTENGDTQLKAKIGYILDSGDVIWCNAPEISKDRFEITDKVCVIDATQKRDIEPSSTENLTRWAGGYQHSYIGTVAHVTDEYVMVVLDEFSEPKVVWMHTSSNMISLIVTPPVESPPPLPSDEK